MVRIMPLRSGGIPLVVVQLKRSVVRLKDVWSVSTHHRSTEGGVGLARGGFGPVVQSGKSGRGVGAPELDGNPNVTSGFRSGRTVENVGTKDRNLGVSSFHVLQVPVRQLLEEREGDRGSCERCNLSSLVPDQKISILLRRLRSCHGPCVPTTT